MCNNDAVLWKREELAGLNHKILVVKAKQVWLGQKLERKSTSVCPIFLPVFIDAGEPKSVLGMIWGYFQNERRWKENCTAS